MSGRRRAAQASENTSKSEASRWHKILFQISISEPREFWVVFNKFNTIMESWDLWSTKSKLSKQKQAQRKRNLQRQRNKINKKELNNTDESMRALSLIWFIGEHFLEKKKYGATAQQRQHEYLPNEEN